MTRAAFVTIGTLLLLVFAWPLAAQGVNERLVNGGFEMGDTTGWDTIFFPPDTQISASTTYTRTGNYSGAITLTGSTTASQVGQCADIIPIHPTVEHFTVSSWVYVPEDAANFNWARIRVQYWGTQFEGCAPSLGTFDTENIEVTPGEWTYVEFTTAAPAPDPERGDPIAASVYLRIARTNTVEPLTVYWDDISFYDSGPTAVSFIAARTTTLTNYAALGLLTAGLLILLSWPILARRRQANTRLGPP